MRINVDACKCMEHGEKECLEAKAFHEQENRWIKTHDEMEQANIQRRKALKSMESTPSEGTR